MAKLALSAIRTDGGTQTRAAIQPDAVKDYADAIEAGETLPPVTVYHDGSDYWLADGFHRLDAYRKLEAREIDADVRQGTRRDAVLHSVGANATHGLRRTNEDKRRAVQVLLDDAEWREWSDREIARRAGVSAPTVATLRPTVKLLQSTERKGSDGRIINTANIGKPKPAESPPPRFIKTYSPPPLPDPEPEPLEPDEYVFPPDTPQEVLEAASKPMPTGPSAYEKRQAFLKDARYDETVKVGDAIRKLLRDDLAELIYGPSGVFLGPPNMWRLVQLEMQKGKADESAKTITLN